MGSTPVWVFVKYKEKKLRKNKREIYYFRRIASIFSEVSNYVTEVVVVKSLKMSLFIFT